MNAKKLTGLLLTAGLCLSLLAGCGSAAGTSASTTSGSASSGTGTAEDTSLQDVKTSGTLRVGMCPEYAPFESVDSSGSIVGFDPSLAAALAQQLGVKVECVNTPWEGLIAGLNNGDYDVIMRITGELLAMLKKYQPIWINTHFSHPREITPDSARACESIVDAGIPLGNQTVLLRGINNSAATLKELFLKLVHLRVRPYYLYQCDLSRGIGHFRTTVDEGIDIMPTYLVNTASK